MNGMKFKCVFIRQKYFNKNSHLVEMLDAGNVNKQSQRNYIFLGFEYNGNTLLVPLRSNIPDITKLGKVAYKVPSESRPNAGLDYRKILIVNDINDIEEPKYTKLAVSQQKIISNNFSIIKNEVINYIDGYIKSVNKNRHKRDKKYCFSTLHNFHNELGINKVDKTG